MAINILDSWQLTATSSAAPGSRTVSAGSNRVLVYYIGEESSSREPTAVTYGGEPMTQAILRQTTGGFPVSASLWILNDAGIEAASGTSFAVTFDGAHNGQFRSGSASYESVNQINPIVDSDSSIADGAVAAGLSLASEDGGLGLAAWAEGSSAAGINVAWTNATERLEVDASSSYHSMSSVETTDAGFAPSVNAGATPDLNVLVAFTLRQAAVEASVEQASETDTSQPVTTAKVAEAGLALEADAAQSVMPAKAVAVGQVSETDTAPSMVGTRTVAIGVATETETAASVSASRGVEVGLATETDTASPTTVSGGTQPPSSAPAQRRDVGAGTGKRVLVYPPDVERLIADVAAVQGRGRKAAVLEILRAVENGAQPVFVSEARSGRRPPDEVLAVRTRAAHRLAQIHRDMASERRDHQAQLMGADAGKAAHRPHTAHLAALFRAAG